MSYITEDEHFKHFASALETTIERYGGLNEESSFYDRQKRQVENLIELEEQFKRALISHKWGAAVYRDFVKMIVEDKRNVLAARPYFRERQDVFAKEIGCALKDGNVAELYRFRINYPFVTFVMKSRRWGKSGQLVQLAKQIQLARQELIEVNLPLAISRARIFWSRTPKAQLTYMDLVQISCEGLIAAIDKFCPPFTAVFRSVAIGRMTGNFISEYSETLVHFYPTDKRKIYRANKLVGKFAEPDFERLAEKVNDGADTTHQTTPSEIADLLAASSCFSIDAVPSDDDTTKPVDYAADDSYRPDLCVENDEALIALRGAISELTLIEKKLLAMKGVTL